MKKVAWRAALPKDPFRELRAPLGVYFIANSLKIWCTRQDSNLWPLPSEGKDIPKLCPIIIILSDFCIFVDVLSIGQDRLSSIFQWHLDCYDRFGIYTKRNPLPRAPNKRLLLGLVQAGIVAFELDSRSARV